MEIKTALEKLFALHTFGVKLGLTNIKNFLSFLGNPQLKLKAIHLAGSNGKGSTAAFITSILMEAGYKVGLYTSPHFVKFNERIIINGVQIDDKTVAEFISLYWDYINEHQLTFFEVTTAMAFEYFCNQEVDYAVIETGLGGRLDATNVLNPLAVVITSISLEHTNILGTRLSSIASEKAAIIKPKSKVFTAVQPKDAEDVIEQKSTEENCLLFRLKDYVNINDDVIELYNKGIELDKTKVPVKGEYQIFNAALAILTITKTFLCDDKRIILNGIKNVVKNTNLQGRYEIYKNDPTLILESAHNIAGVTQFLTEFDKESSNYKKKIVLFGAMKDKAHGEMLVELNKSFDEIHLTQIDYERSAKIEDLKSICNELNITAYEERNPLQYINNFLKGERNNCLVVLGSMYLLGEVKIRMQL
ncbi:MAG: bifunctional folylpolyglutamate synthase/dihydrofolate synthase [Ignavibacterium sp.]|nr:MAG: bifunctional folylpolyglutamate synthase/dihydrofolate synthase [Ignavibacterium sp.]